METRVLIRSRPHQIHIKHFPYPNDSEKFGSDQPTSLRDIFV